MMTNGALLLAALLVGGLLISYSPLRLARKILCGTPFSKEPDGIFPLSLLWLFDMLSWLIVFYGGLRLFNVLYPALS